MTDKEINIAIAEACGAVWYRIPNPGKRDREYRLLAHPLIHEYPDQSPEWLVRADGSERMCNWEYMVREGHLSDYCHDLNAMHDAVFSTFGDRKKQDQESATMRVQYHSHLKIICETAFNTLEASAAQRSEAFLKTLGKWADESQNNH